MAQEFPYAVDEAIKSKEEAERRRRGEGGEKERKRKKKEEEEKKKKLGSSHCGSAGIEPSSCP